MLLALKIRTIRAAVIGGLILAAGPILGAEPQLGMLDQLAPGKWEMRDRSGAITERICVPHGRQLVQLRHPGPLCDTYVIQDQPNEVVVQYTCRGRGYGRTHIRRETNRLVQMDGTGIADGLPFDFVFEARRVGDC
jgi:hypothetical protein